MAALVKQLLEADGFLHNVQTLPSFHRVQDLQLQKLKDYMNKKTIDDQSFAESSHAVEKMRHFDQEQKQQLQQCIVDAYDRSFAAKKYKELQDYVNMPFMFPTNVWKEMYSHTTMEKRIFFTCTWLARIGLRNPSEASLGAITVVCNWREWSHQLPPKRTMLEEHMKMKQLAKKYLKANVCSCKGPLILPTSFQNLPEAIRTAFSGQALGKFKIGVSQRLSPLYFSFQLYQ